MTQPQLHDRMALPANPRTLDRPWQPWPQPGLGFSPRITVLASGGPSREGPHPPKLGDGQDAST
jgi:hypothetical protein